MGISRNFGYGYGVIIEPNEELEKEAEKVLDIEALLQDYYPLLAECYAGYGYDTNLVCIKGTVTESYDVLLLPLEFEGISDDEYQQLKDFCKRFNIQETPRWYSYCAIGNG